MTLFPIAALAPAVLAALILGAPAARAQDGVLVNPARRPPPACNGLAGLYDDGRTVHVARDGRSVSILVSPRLPLARGTCRADTVRVDFGSGQMLDGVHDGRVLRWPTAASGASGAEPVLGPPIRTSPKVAGRGPSTSLLRSCSMTRNGRYSPMGRTRGRHGQQGL